MFDKAVFVYKKAIEKYEKKRSNILAEIIPELYFDLASLYQEIGSFEEAGNAYQKTYLSYNHPLNNDETPDYIIISNFLAAEMKYKSQNFQEALLGYNQAISLYSENKKKVIVENLFRSRFQVGKILKKQGELTKALKIFRDLMEDEKEEGLNLWRKLAAENYREISNRLEFSDYIEN